MAEGPPGSPPVCNECGRELAERLFLNASQHPQVRLWERDERMVGTAIVALQVVAVRLAGRCELKTQELLAKYHATLDELLQGEAKAAEQERLNDGYEIPRPGPEA